MNICSAVNVEIILQNDKMIYEVHFHQLDTTLVT